VLPTWQKLLSKGVAIDLLNLARAYRNDECDRNDANALMEDLFGRWGPKGLWYAASSRAPAK
jgi:hypothetical protein